MRIHMIADGRCDGVKALLQGSEHIEFSDDKPNCDFDWYVIGPGDLQNTRIPACLASLIDASNKQPNRILFAYIEHNQFGNFTPHQLSSLTAIGQMVQANGAMWLTALPETHQQWLQLRSNLSTRLMESP